MNSLNPGFIRSNLLRDHKGRFFPFLMRTFASPPEVGADRIVRLAVSSEYRGISGTYVNEDTIASPNPEALDAKVRERLMQLSEATVARWTVKTGEDGRKE